MSRFLPRLSLLALFGALVAAPLPAAAQSKNLEWTSGSPGGAWFTQTTGVSTLVMEATPGVNIRIVPAAARTIRAASRPASARSAWASTSSAPPR